VWLKVAGKQQILFFSEMPGRRFAVGYWETSFAL